MSSEVKIYDWTPRDMKEFHGPARVGLYVLASDYADLEAECERLNAMLEDWEADANLLEKERDAARAQLAAIQGGIREAVGFDRNAAYAACPESGCDWGSFYVGWKAAATQHQRITAAMAAEVEKWSSIAVMLEQANAGVAQLNGKLRARIAELEGKA